MNDFLNHCFVCGIEINIESTIKNKQLNLPVCPNCQGTEQEKDAIEKYLEGLAEGFVCGCI